MNEGLFTCDEGLALITGFEGPPRLQARECEGGAIELSWGVTFGLNGETFQLGDTCTEDEALALFRHALETFEAAVKRHVTVPLNKYQFSALVAFCYNVGEANFAKSTVLREVNANRFDDAAAAFGMWVFATRGGYKQALRGLLRRRYAEACLFLGYDWKEACANDAIALQRQAPVRLPGTDRVIYKTPFKDVLRVAQNYPLPALPEPVDAVLFDPAPTLAPASKSAQAGLPDSNTATAPSVEPVAGQPGASPQPTLPAGLPPVKEPVKIEHDAPVASKNSPNLNMTQPAAPPSGPLSDAAGKAPPQAPPAAAAPNVPAKPKDATVIAAKGIDVKAIPYGDVDPTQTSNMSGSRRVAGMVVVGLGSMTQILAAREIVSSSVGAVFYDMTRDPIIVALLIGGAFYVFGWLTRKRGTQIITKGMVQAKTVLK